MQVRSDEDCDDDLELVKSKNNTQSNDPEGSPYTAHTAQTTHMKGQNQNKNKNQDQDQHEKKLQNPLHSALKLKSRRSTIQFVAIDHHHSHSDGHSGDLGLAMESANIASSLDSSDVTTCKEKKPSSTSTSTSTSTFSTLCPVLICSNLTGDTSLLVNEIHIYHASYVCVLYYMNNPYLQYHRNAIICLFYNMDSIMQHFIPIIYTVI
jgi:hypothetical protein